jgi:hypothetical protein
VDWYKEFKKVWGLIMDGQYSAAAAAAALKTALWARQTLVRVKNFQQALLKLKDKPAPKSK